MTEEMINQEVEEASVSDAAVASKIDEYMLSDILGSAPPKIRELLRSPKWVNQWSASLARFAMNASLVGELSKAQRIRLTEIRNEAARLKKGLPREGQQADMPALYSRLQHDLDIDFTDRTIAEIQAVLLGEVVMELRALNDHFLKEAP